MKISLQQIKNILMEVRNVDFSKIGADELKSPAEVATNIMEILDTKVLNNVCRIITGRKDVDYTQDILSEDGALEVISDFLLSIISKWENSKNFQMLIKTYILAKIQKKEAQV